MTIRIAAAALLAAACACFPAGAQDKLLLPLAPALSHPDMQKALRGMPVRFGVQASGPVTSGVPVQTRSWARPTDRRGGGAQLPDGRPVNMTQQETCQLALRYTLEFLADEAREKGGKALVDVVSHVDDVETNSTDSFACVPGRASSTVYLKGRAVPSLDPR